MRSGIRWMAVVAAAVAVWGVSSRLNHAQPLAPTGGTAVAVVDLFRAFNEFEQTKALDQKMRDHQALIRQEADRKLELIKAEEQTLAEAFTPNTPEWFKQDKKVKELKLQAKVWGTLEQDSIDENYLRWVKQTYKTVTDEVAATARRRGVQLVVTRDELDEAVDPRLSPVEQRKLLLQQILNRKVVYSDAAIDLTDEVLANLNAAFDKAGGPASVQFAR